VGDDGGSVGEHEGEQHLEIRHVGDRGDGAVQACADKEEVQDPDCNLRDREK